MQARRYWSTIKRLHIEVHIQFMEIHMKNHFSKAIILAAVIGLVGCSSNTQNQNTAVGAVTGGVAGGLIGSAVGGGAAVAVGAVAGALVGGVIGHSMDSSDNARTYTVLDHNRKGRATMWVNNKTGARYTVVPVSGRMMINGHPNCRKYRATSMMNGQSHTMYGYACRQPNGSWMTVNP